ncbi:MAG: glycosyltransferase family 4 protein [Thermoplasmata archaeon]
MNILMLLSNPFVHDHRVYMETQSLLRHRHSVTLIAWDRLAEHPPREVIDGVDVIRIRTTGIMKLIPFDIFRLKSWWRRARSLAMELAERSQFDVVHCHDLDTLPIGVWLKDMWGVKLIYDAHEVFTYMMKGEVPSHLIRRFQKMEDSLMMRADRMITVGEKYKEYFLSRGKPDDEITLVMNAKDIAVDSYMRPSNTEPTVLYIGALRRTRFVTELALAGSRLNGIRVVIAGGGAEEERIREIASGSENVEFLGKIPMKEVIPLTLQCDAVFCMFDPEHPLYRIGFPNKFFEALATGRPIIASEGTYVGELVERLKCGIVFRPNMEGIRDGLIFVRDNPSELERMGNNALEAARNTYNWTAQEAALMEVYDSL